MHDEDRQYLDINECHELVRETFARIESEVDELRADNRLTAHWPPEIVWDRARTRMGIAYGLKWRIGLSRPLFERTTREERRNTVIHEACHLVQYRVERIRQCRFPPHGRLWRNLMVIAGIADPRRCHDLDVAAMGLVRRVEAVCARGHRLQLSVRMANLIRKRPHSRICAKCPRRLRSRLNLTP